MEAAMGIQMRVDAVNRACVRLVLGIVKDGEMWRDSYAELMRRMRAFNESLEGHAQERMEVRVPPPSV